MINSFRKYKSHLIFILCLTGLAKVVHTNIVQEQERNRNLDYLTLLTVVTQEVRTRSPYTNAWKISYTFLSPRDKKTYYIAVDNKYAQNGRIVEGFVNEGRDKDTFPDQMYKSTRYRNAIGGLDGENFTRRRLTEDEEDLVIREFKKYLESHPSQASQSAKDKSANQAASKQYNQ